MVIILSILQCGVKLGVFCAQSGVNGVYIRRGHRWGLGQLLCDILLDPSANMPVRNTNAVVFLVHVLVVSIGSKQIELTSWCKIMISCRLGWDWVRHTMTGRGGSVV